MKLSQQVVLCFLVIVSCGSESQMRAATEQESSTTALSAADTSDTSTDFLSDDEFYRLPREARHRRTQRMTLSRYEPSGHPTIEHLRDYLDRYKQFNVYDSRLYLYNVTAEHVANTTGSVKLSGEVSVDRYKSGTEKTLTDLGFNVVENEIAVLPADRPDGELYGVSTTAVATMRKEPRARAEQVDAVAMGGWVRVLRDTRPLDITVTRGARMPHEPRPGQDDGDDQPTPIAELAGKWRLAQSLEGYIGFVRADQFMWAPGYRLPDAMLTRPTTVTVEGKSIVLPTGGFVYETPSNLRLASAQDFLKALVTLAPPADKGEKLLYRPLHLAVTLPATAPLVSINRPLFTQSELRDSLKQFCSTHYVWGGVTERGIDCSGFAQWQLRTKSIFLPRDAVEQAIVGQIVAFGPDIEKNAQPGDLIFFMADTGRIGHVGVSIGGGRFVQSDDKGVRESSLADHPHERGETYLESAIFARRIGTR